ncbi:MAG: lipid A biosynthesis lauroyl acyltransferase [Burkholderiaceae bacterium]|jgi:KDO2-lipid IV(A) lauroyltransferase|nr:MAG: lipid A biosynthesis lauroyl acyltransferase [Burkholderiaceae bacterium]
MKIASHAGILFMRAISPLPLAWLRALGWVMGGLLYLLAAPRRRVARTNLELCLPQHSARERRALVHRNFVCFAQTWLDRSWLWHGRPEVTRRRLRLIGAVAELDGNAPTLLFAPHFLGMDAGATALSQQVPRQFNTIVTPQRDPIVDDWISRGRRRFGNARLFTRFDGTKTIVASLRAGEPLYLLPDMNFGPQESIFVPFYGVLAATVPSLSRFARLGRAKVVPVLTRITPGGYETEVLPAWTDFPTEDIEADTALMNRRLQTYIDAMPEQYYWVHKRFKTRPAGEQPVY